MRTSAEAREEIATVRASNANARRSATEYVAWIRYRLPPLDGSSADVHIDYLHDEADDHEIVDRVGHRQWAVRERNRAWCGLLADFGGNQ